MAGKKKLQDGKVLAHADAEKWLMNAEAVIAEAVNAQEVMDRAREMRQSSGGAGYELFALALEAGDMAETMREFVRAAYKMRNVFRAQYPVLFPEEE